jgi:hypothetical protein
VCLREPGLVRKVRLDVERYAQLGGKVARTRLLRLADRVGKLLLHHRNS